VWSVAWKLDIIPDWVSGTYFHTTPHGPAPGFRLFPAEPDAHRDHVRHVHRERDLRLETARGVPRGRPGRGGPDRERSAADGERGADLWGGRRQPLNQFAQVDGGEGEQQPSGDERITQRQLQCRGDRAGVVDGWPTEKVKAPQTGWVSAEITHQATV